MNPNPPHTPPQPPTQTEINDFCSAAKMGYGDKVSSYLDRYGELIINERDNVRDTALTWAAWMGHADICRLLIERGAAVDALGMTDRSALGWAARGGRQEAARVLLEAGADINLKDAEGNSPLQIASDANRQELVMLMNDVSQRRAEDLRAKKERTMVCPSCCGARPN
ncbi:MAG TPA: ankyrin repeat domain-containing protein [Patescibacteria group bacterium]|nr:ankyrin repeat domain-containing protein [Patescibacteria group bacterium]